MELVAIILSVGALCVAMITLYETSLRNAEITVDRIAIERELGTGGMANNLPDDERLLLCVDIANTGARGGTLTSIELASVRCIGSPPFPWSGVSRTYVVEGGEWNRYIQAPTWRPLPLEAGDVKTRFLAGPWIPGEGETHHPPAQAPPLAYAERLRGLESVEATVRWKYTRLAGGWKSLLSRSRSRETVIEEATFRVPASEWIETCKSFWREYPAALETLDGKDHVLQ